MNNKSLAVSHIARLRRKSDLFSNGMPIFFPLLKDLKITYEKLSYFKAPEKGVGEYTRPIRAIQGQYTEWKIYNILRGLIKEPSERFIEIVKTIRDLTEDNYKLQRKIEYDGITGKIDIYNDKILIDIKDSTNLSTTSTEKGVYSYYNDFSQLVLYYILGIKVKPNEFNTIERLIIFNVNLGIYYTLMVEDLKNKVDLDKILEIAKTPIPDEELHDNSIPKK